MPEKLVLVEWYPDGKVHQAIHLEMVRSSEDSPYKGSLYPRLYHTDVNWCERDGCHYHHRSGSGPGPTVFLPGRVGGRSFVWAAPEIDFKRWEGKDCHGHEVPLRREDAGLIGYDLVPEHPGDPTEKFLEGDGYWCELCKDWFPHSEDCEHGDEDD